jgi:hypothetical protein
MLALTGTLKTEEFWKQFFECSGEFDGAEFWDALPEEFGLERLARESVTER